MRTLKLRIYPNKEQKTQIEKTIGCCRFIYNWGLERRIQHYVDKKTTLHKYRLIAESIQLKNQDGFTWLKEVSAQSLQQSIIRMDRSYRRFFAKLSKFPKFKSKKNPVHSFDVPQNFDVSFVNKKIRLPKIGYVRFRNKLNYRDYGNIKRLIVLRDRDKYYVCVVCESVKLPVTEGGILQNSIGLDLGIKTFVTLSNGQKIVMPKLSKNISKAARQRKDFLHKLSTKLVDNQDWDTIVIEDMRVTEMVCRIKNVNRAMYGQGWRMFIEMLHYKCEERGKNFVIISPFEAASRTCECGRKNDDLKIASRTWTCSCGLTHDRDILAAKNIQKFGTRNSATCVRV